MIRARSISDIIGLRKAGLAVILSAAAALNLTSADAQQAAGNNQLQNCITFKNLADQHAAQAETVQKIIAEEEKKYSGEEARKFIEIRNKAAQSEWELAGLAQESYRKCMRDYLSAAQAPAQQAPAANPPVAAAQPVPALRPAQVRQQPVMRQQPPEVVQGPGLGLIPFGLDILGVGRAIRENR